MNRWVSGGTNLKSGTAMQGFVAAAFDPFLASASTSTGGGSHCLIARCVAQTSATITNLYCGFTTAGSGATATTGQTPQAAVYSSSGTQLAATGDIGSLLTTGSSVLKALPLTAGVAVTAGREIYLALFWSGTTSPLFARASSQAFMLGAGVGAVPANQRFADIQGGTSLPASLNPAALTASTVPWWIGAA